MTMLWEYEDNRGVRHEGYVERTFDRGGTDVSYHFRDAETGELTVRSNLAFTTDARALNRPVAQHEPGARFYGGVVEHDDGGSAA